MRFLTRINNSSISIKILAATSAVLVMSITLSDWFLFNKAEKLLMKSAWNSMQRAMNQQSERVTNFLDGAKRDVILLSHAPSMEDIIKDLTQSEEDLHTPEKHAKHHQIARQFAKMIETQGYLQIRLINAKTGMEIVRVERPAADEMFAKSIPHESLQNKGDTDYVKAGAKLHRGEVYISDINLNREHDKIILPPQPTLRFVAPVFEKTIQPYDQQLSPLLLAEYIRQFDKQLTAAATRAAQTGNLSWWENYKYIAPRLDKALAEARKHMDISQVYLVDKIADANIELVNIEENIFKLVSMNKAEDAEKLITSEKYLTLKDEYNSTLNTLIANLDKEHHDEHLSDPPIALVVINTHFDDLLSSFRAIRSHDTIMVNQKGQYLYHDNPEKQFAFEFDQNTNGLAEDEPHVWRHLAGGTKEVMSFDQHDELHVSQRIFFDDKSTENFIGLVLTKTKQEVLGPVKELSRAAFAISALSTCLSLVLILWIVRRQTGPIIQLTKQAAEIVGGNLDKKLPIPKNKDEVGRLARTFARLISELQKRNNDAQAQAKEIQSLNQDLEKRIQERTASLLKATEEAEAASVAKSQFLATMSHEIRTPMNGVLGMAQLLKRSPLNKRQREYVATINRSGDALLTIINDILDFSKIESGKLELEPIEFDLERTAHETTNLLALRAHEKDIELLFEYDLNAPKHFRGDPGRIRQILLNLLGNAIKFTSRGYVQLQIKCTECKDGQAKLILSVTDTGIGISEESQHHMFQAFSQADASTTRKFGGTGLGLAICKRLIALMGGSIEFTSKEGQGSTFWLTLTLPISDRPSALPKANLAGIQVLIVDDHPVNLKILKSMLEHWEMQVHQALNWREALEKLDIASKSHPIQLAILDYMMPEKDGATLAADIKKKTDIPLIVLTSASERGDINKFQKAGFSAYLSKPFRSDILKETIAVTLGQQEVGEHSQSLITRHRIEEQRSTEEDLPDMYSGSVLLVEDNEVNQLVAADMLEQAGLQVTIADNGVKAIERWKEDKFDLILMDCLMPEMDGFAATRQIRSLESGERTPIIALTANVMASDREACQKAGMDDFIGKPIEFRQILNILKKWLGKTPETNVEDSPDLPVKDDLLGQLLDEARYNKMQARLKNRMAVVVEAFLSESQELIDSMATAANRNDQQTLVRIAHSLKSSGATVGAEKLSLFSERLEKNYLDGLTDDWQTDQQQLQQIFQQTKEAIIPLLTNTQ